MTLSSTAILVMARTNDAQELIIPFQFRRNYSRQFLQTVFVWIVATGLTGEWAVDRVGDILTNGLFVMLMSVIFICAGIACIEALCERNKTRQR